MGAEQGRRRRVRRVRQRADGERRARRGEACLVRLVALVCSRHVDCRLAAVDIQVRGSSEKNPLHKQQLDTKLRRAIEKSQSGNMMLLP